MARKESIFTVADEGRDKGKTFLIRELSAAEQELWAGEVFFALLNTGVELPPGLLDPRGGVQGLGMAELASLSFEAFSKLSFESARPLLEKMWDCVQLIPNPKEPRVVRPLMQEDDIEEVKTRLALRKAIFDLHFDFFIAGAK